MLEAVRGLNSILIFLKT